MAAVGTAAVTDCETYDDHVELVAELGLEREISGLALVGDFAFVTLSNRGLCVLDLSDVATPRLVATYPIDNTCSLKARSGHHLYLSVGADRIWIMDISEPLSPVRIANWSTGIVGTVYAKDSLLFVSVGDQLKIYDVTDPGAPLAVGGMTTPRAVYRIHLVGNAVYFTLTYNSGQDRVILVYDVTDPAVPVKVGEYYANDRVYDFVVYEKRIYISSVDAGLTIANAWDPDAPNSLRTISHFDTGGRLLKLAVVGARLIAVGNLSSYDVDELMVFDVSDPARPWLVAAEPDEYAAYLATDGERVVTGQRRHNANVSLRFFQIPEHLASPFASMPGAKQIAATRIGVSGHVQYVAARDSLCYIVDSSTPRRPTVIGRLAAPDIKGATATGSRLYLACHTSGVEVYDIAMPMEPRRLGTIANGSAYPVADVGAHETWAYVGGLNRGVDIVDVADPMAPVVVSSLDNLGSVSQIEVAWPYLYLLQYQTSVAVVDVSDPSAPDVLWVNPYCHNPTKLALADGLLLVTDRIRGFVVYDLADPGWPRFAGQIGLSSWVSALAARDGYAYVGLRGERFVVVDCTVPASPAVAGEMCGFTALAGMAATDGCLLLSANRELITAPLYCAGLTHVADSMERVDGDVVVAPNPFNARTALEFELAETSIVDLTIFDVRGRLVVRHDLGRQSAGPFRTHWDGRDHDGRAVPSGVYFARFRTDHRERMARLVLAK